MPAGLVNLTDHSQRGRTIEGEAPIAPFTLLSRIPVSVIHTTPPDPRWFYAILWDVCAPLNGSIAGIFG